MRSLKPRTGQAAASLVLVLAVAFSSGCTAGSTQAQQGKSGQAAASPPPAPVSELTARGADYSTLLPQETGTVQPARLAADLLPPTNKWFSSLAFGATPQPVFPMPLSFLPSGSGIEIGLPKVAARPDTIFGSHIPAVHLGFESSQFTVSGYDAQSVSLQYLDEGGVSGVLRAAEGSPFISYTAARDQVLRLGTAFQGLDTTTMTTVHAGQEYVVTTPAGTGVAAGASATEVRVAGGQTVTVFATAADMTATEMSGYAKSPLTGVDVGFSVGGEKATTSLTYRTADQSPTLFAAAPHQEVDKEPVEGSYDSIYGPLSLYAGTSFSFDVPAMDPAGTLDLTRLPDNQRSALVEQLATDINATKLTADDTYFGGKQLARLATLMQLARQTGADDLAEKARVQLDDALRQWLEKDGCLKRSVRCFTYDPVLGGVVGKQPSFGSEEFNDHHYHYGYFIYAAALLGETDTRFIDDAAPAVAALVADIAALGTNDRFPERRGFDTYMGHSWASGTSPFADGNNQESTSEALTAWNGVALWAKLVGDPDTEQQAKWMLSLEAETSSLYWTAPDLDSPVYDGFEHSFVALNWGGKRDSATWFSPEPNAKLGIQLLPMAPVMIQALDQPAVTRNLAEAVPNGYNVQFGDYLIMYLALADPGLAREQLSLLSDTTIDNGNSRSYIMAWIASLEVQQ